VTLESEIMIFIDDKIENCETATTLGMQVIHFKSPAQLKGGLAQLGIQAA
jgi:FMN phosphatase YigB (HAD superfamily)